MTAFSYLAPYFSAKVVDRRLGRRAVRRHPDLAQVGLGRRLDRLRQLVQHVGGLVHGAALMPGRRRDLLQRLPEAERPVAGGQLGRDGQAARLEVNQQLPPALRALAHADLEADQFLPALRRRPDQHQHALGLRLHPRLQVDAVRPDVDVAPRRQVAPLPARVVGLPLAPQPRDHRGRQVRGLLAQQRPERLLEVAHRDPAQVEHRQQRIQARRPPCPARQDRRGEADALAASRQRRGRAASPAAPRPGRSRSAPGAPGQPVPHQALTPVRQLHALHRRQERLGFRLDRPGPAAGGRRSAGWPSADPRPSSG